MGLVLGLMLVATAGTTIGVGTLGWRHEMKRRRTERELRAHKAALAAVKLPEDGIFIANRATRRQVRKALKGTYLVTGVGTYGMRQVYKLLGMLWESGLEEVVGSILIVENAETLRAWFAMNVPSVFTDRIVYGFSKEYVEGFENRPVGETWNEVDAWGVPIQTASEAVIDLHQRRNASSTPEIWAFASEGGQVVLSVVVADTLHTKWPEARMVGFTALPVDEALRENFEWLKPRLEQHGCYGWIGLDNLSDDPQSLDWGLVAVLIAFAQGGLYEGDGMRAGNAFTLIFGKKPGAIIVYQLAVDSVVGYPLAPDGSATLGFWAYQETVVSAIRKGLRRIARGQGLWSIDLPVGDRTMTTIDVVVTAVEREAARDIEEKVKAGRTLLKKTQKPTKNGATSNGHGPHEEDYWGQPNYHMVFGTIGIVIDHAKPVGPVIVVRLTRVLGGGQNWVKEIVKVPQRRQIRAHTKQLVGTQESAKKEETA